MRRRADAGHRSRRLWKVPVLGLAVMGASFAMLGCQTPQQARAPQPQSSSFLSGVIEGFYGPSWSVPDTLQVMQFIHTHGMNAFLYAPKYDPYERAEWSVLYPPGPFATLHEIVNGALDNHVQFIYSISPGLSITYSSAQDRRLLLAKIAQLQAIGVHSFMLSFDDIGEGLSARDNRVYHGDLARAQASLADYVYEVERKRDPHFRLLIAQTVYYGTSDNAYWVSIKKYLLPQITPIWTGAWVLNDRITAQQVAQVQQDMGHRVLIWDNYPVNDFTYVVAKRPELFLGPLVGRAPGIPAEVAGYLFNPMYQARASEIALWTAAAYLRDPQHYQPQASWLRAIRAIGGPAAPALLTFAQDNRSYYYDNIRPPVFESAVASFWRTQPHGDALAHSALAHQFREMAAANGALAAHLPDRALYAEIAPWTSELSEQGQVGLQALAFWQADSGGKLSASQTRTLDGQIARLANNRLTVASDAVLAFLRQFVLRQGH